MSTSTRRALAGCVTVAVLAVAGCTSTDSSGSDITSGPTTPSASVVQTPARSQTTLSEVSPSPADVSSGAKASTRGTTASSPSVAEPTSRSATAAPTDPASLEQADRAAVEAQWARFWEIYRTIARTPPNERSIRLSAVAVNPAYSDVLKDFETMEKDGLDTYGQVQHRISWQTPIKGSRAAVISDCQDQSAYGSIEKQGGKKRTVGVPRDNMRGEFVKSSDDIWRLKQVYFLLDTPC